MAAHNNTAEDNNTAADNNIAERIMVALDFPSLAEARTLVEQLKGIPCYMKVGMQLFYAAGPQVVRELKEMGYSVFVDLKLHDIPNTVKGAAHSLTHLGADMFNVHAAGGIAMMEAALAGMDKALLESPQLKRPTVIAVTQLTSTSDKVLHEEIGIPQTVQEVVVHYARCAKQAGLDGVVASPHEVGLIKEALGQSFQTITPGIRPAGSARGDQVRVMTPREAMVAGTDYIVVGRPITAAAKPRAALLQMIEEMNDIG